MLVQQLPPEMQEKARNELNEIPSEVPGHMKLMREWMKEHPEYYFRTDDLWLLNFLRGCKYNLEKTKSKLEYFHKVRLTAPAFFANRDPLLSDIQDALKSGIFLPLVKEDHVTIMVRFANVDPNKFPLVLLVKSGLMLAEMVLNENKYCMISGFNMVLDHSGLSYAYLPQTTPDFIRKLLSTLQNAYPVRAKGVHLINSPIILQAIIRVFKPVAKKVFGRLHVYNKNKINDLFDIVPKSLLPVEYGGDGQTVNEIISFWKAKVESYRDWYLEENQYYSNIQKANLHN